MAKKQETQTPVAVPTAAPAQVVQDALSNGSAQQLFDLLAKALTQAVKDAKGPEKKTFATRKPGDPWSPKDGSKKLKLRRTMYQHGLKIDPDMITNEEITLLNKLKTGRYFNDWVKVYKRKDQGIDIDYPVKTAAQRVKLSQMGITSQIDPATGVELKTGFHIFLERMIHEGNQPKKPEIDPSDE